MSLLLEITALRLFSTFILTLYQSLADPDRGVDSHCDGGNAKNLAADAVGIPNDTGTWNLDVGKSFIEGSHGVPEGGFCAADAAVSHAYRPDAYIIETS